MGNSPIIVSLDFSDADQALRLTEQLQPELCQLKVGKELFTSSGAVFISRLIDQGFKVFLDLKFHDIPNTVAKACAVATDLGVWMINVHASGGMEMMSLARESIEKARHRPLLIAVTVLTSMDQVALQDIGISCTVEEQVLKLSQLSHDAGLDGVVCSGQEVKKLRDHFGKGFTLVTPGIRPVGADNNDQRRVMTPRQAIQAGSDYLVIGRPITQVADPVKSINSIIASISTTNS